MLRLEGGVLGIGGDIPGQAVSPGQDPGLGIGIVFGLVDHLIGVHIAQVNAALIQIHRLNIMAELDHDPGDHIRLPLAAFRADGQDLHLAAGGITHISTLDVTEVDLVSKGLKQLLAAFRLVHQTSGGHFEYIAAHQYTGIEEMHIAALLVFSRAHIGCTGGIGAADIVEGSAVDRSRVQLQGVFPLLIRVHGILGGKGQRFFDILDVILLGGHLGIELEGLIPQVHTVTTHSDHRALPGEFVLVQHRLLADIAFLRVGVALLVVKAVGRHIIHPHQRIALISLRQSSHREC